MSIKIENDILVASFYERGAELYSLESKKTGIDYIYHTVPPMFCGSSPLLFPIVGRVKDNKYTYKQREYRMNIHGFACFQKFELHELEMDKVTFVLSSEGKYIEYYPFEFKVYVTYTLKNNSLIVSHKVINLSEDRMHFSIGAHPAFRCPVDNSNRNENYLYFEGTSELVRSKIDMKCGLLFDEQEKVSLQSVGNIDEKLSGGLLSIDNHMFDEDAWVIESNQTHRVSLLDKNKLPYLTVSFEAPLFGMWSPSDRVHPFVCIEPWYGRCDKKSFAGSLEDREWGNVIEKGEEFNSNYEIICNKEC